VKEVNNLLNRLGELDDAPLIWVNKKVYDMAEEIERLNNIINELEKDIKCMLEEFNYPEEVYTLKQIERISNRIKELKENK